MRPLVWLAARSGRRLLAASNAETRFFGGVSTARVPWGAGLVDARTMVGSGQAAATPRCPALLPAAGFAA
jgi:hypothetical protein